MAGIYARKSTEQKNVSDEAKSVTRQVEQATAFAVSKGWTVSATHVYVDDGISGAEFEKRPGFLRLMTALKPRPPFQVLITMDESRLGRDQFQTGYALWQIIQAGVRVFYYLPDREVRLDNATSGFLEQVKLFAAQIERENTAHRTRDAMLKKAREGHVTGGVVFGYDNVPELGPDGKRAHTDRQVNALEAAVVVRIFEMARQGLGLTRIAKSLNREAAPAPKPRHLHRREAWCPTSIREVLRRRLYIGEIIYDRRGTDPIRVSKPTLRIVTDELWAAVQARLAHTRQQYLKSTDGKLWGRPPTGIAGAYLLSRLAACGKCGGPLYVRSSAWGRGRKFFYACLAYHTRGVRGCSNGRPIPMTVADTAVVEAVEKDLLRMEVIQAALARAIEAARREDDQADTSREALQARLDTLARELVHLTQAIAQGGAGVATLITAITQREAERAEVEVALARRAALTTAPALDDAALLSAMKQVLMEWQTALHQNVAQSQQALRKLLAGRLVFTPDSDGGYTFTAEGRIEAVVAGRLPGLPTSVVSPTGFEPVLPD